MLRAALVVLAISSSARAQVSLAIEPRFGVSIPSDGFGASSVGGLEVDLIIPQGMSFGLNVSVASPLYRGEAMVSFLPAAQSYQLRQTELTVGPVVSYRRSLDDDTQLRVGGGPIARKLWVGETTTPGSMFTSNNTQLGVEGVIAIERRVGFGSIVVDARVIGAWTPTVCANVYSCSSSQATELTGSDHTSLLTELSVGYELEFGGSSKTRRIHQHAPRDISSLEETAEPPTPDYSDLYKQGVAAAARDECGVARAVAQDLRKLDGETYARYIRDVGVARCL
jgi:hypothetical protein